MKSSGQTNFVYFLILIALVAMIFMNINQDSGQTVMSINELAAQITQGNVSKIVEDENSLAVTLADGSENVAIKETGATLVEQLLSYGVTADDLSHSNISIEVKQPSEWGAVISFLGYILPFILVGAAFFFIFRQAQGSNNAAISFGKSRARMFSGDQPKVTFSDVGRCG